MVEGAVRAAPGGGVDTGEEDWPSILHHGRGPVRVPERGRIMRELFPPEPRRVIVGEGRDRRFAGEPVEISEKTAAQLLKICEFDTSRRSYGPTLAMVKDWVEEELREYPRLCYFLNLASVGDRLKAIAKAHGLASKLSDLIHEWPEAFHRIDPAGVMSAQVVDDARKAVLDLKHDLSQGYRLTSKTETPTKGRLPNEGLKALSLRLARVYRSVTGILGNDEAEARFVATALREIGIKRAASAVAIWIEAGR